MTIPADLFKLTQRRRILKLFQLRGDAGVMVYELMTPRPDGLGVAQYNARIKELRERGHNIVSKKSGHFVLITDKKYFKAATPIEKKNDPSAMKAWNEMGAFLRGEGPKPQTESNFTELVQGALL